MIASYETWNRSLTRSTMYRQGGFSGCFCDVFSVRISTWRGIPRDNTLHFRDGTLCANTAFCRIMDTAFLARRGDRSGHFGSSSQGAQNDESCRCDTVFLRLCRVESEIFE